MNALEDQLLDFFVARDCVIADIGLLQPADPLLDMAGEDLRRRIFITQDQHGASLCLRPEFTIPVCLAHLQRNAGSRRYAYAGAVFRQRREEPAEFVQSGIEDIGNEDRLAADVAAIADCVGAIERAGLTDNHVTIGDQALFEAVLAALDLPVAWQRRLARAFGDLELLKEDMARLSARETSFLESLPNEIATLLREGRRDRVVSHIKDQMEKSGLPASGGRTAAEIADRLIEKAELAATKLDDSHRAALETFLAIEAPVTEAPGQIRDLAKKHGLAIDAALTAFANRASAIAAAKLADNRITFRAAFGRRLDYYTGLVFEVRRASVDRPIAGGGRYDRLMSMLGAGTRIPAVGFSIWIDRLTDSVD